MDGPERQHWGRKFYKQASRFKKGGNLISTVTTTVTTVTTVGAISGTLGAIASLLLIFLLSGKEVADAGEGRLSRILGQHLNIPIVPLLVTFTVIVAVNVLTVV